MKSFKLLLVVLFSYTAGLCQTTTPWSSTPTVAAQTRLFNGTKQIRWLWGTTNVYSVSDSILYFKNIGLGIQDTGKYVMIGNTNNKVFYDTVKRAPLYKPTLNNLSYTGNQKGAGNFLFSQDLTDRYIATDFYGGAIKYRSNANYFNGRGLQLGLWSNTHTFFPVIDIKQDSLTLKGVVTISDTLRAPALYEGTNRVVNSSGLATALTGYVAVTDLANRIQVYRAINLAAWGDSLTAGAGSNGASYPSQLGALAGYQIYNGGVGGETSTQIAARFHADTARWRLPSVLWMGRNNYSNPTQVKADIAACIADMASVGNTQYLVVGITTDTTQVTGSGGWTTITTYNSQQAVTYGNKFLDILPILVAAYNPANANDVANHANGVIPYTLRTLGDGTHPNAAGYGVVANAINNTKISQLFPTPAKIITTQSAEGLFANRSSIDLSIAGSYKVGGLSVAYIPNQNSFLGSIAFGTGGTNWAHTTAIEGYYNTRVGQNPSVSVDLGSANTTGGFSSLLNNTTGKNIAQWGAFGLASNTTGEDLTAIGANAFFSNVSGSKGTGVGGSVFYFSTTGQNLSGIGYGAGQYNIDGNNNSLFGLFAGRYNRHASNNTLGGVSAGAGALNVSDISNYSIWGYQGGGLLLTGSDGGVIVGAGSVGASAVLSKINVFGANSGNGLNTGADKTIIIGNGDINTTLTGPGGIYIGNDLNPVSSTSTNVLNIGNLLFGTAMDGTGSNISSGNIGIRVKTPLATLHVNSALASSGITNTFISQHNYSSGNEEPMWAITNGGNTALGGISFPLKPNSSSLAMRFKTTSQGNGLRDVMQIDGSGSVWIGTTLGGSLFQVTQPTGGVGVISTTASGTTVTGSGTLFATTFKVGQTITANGETRTISAIASNTSMTTDAWTSTNTSIVYTLTGGDRFKVGGNGLVTVGSQTGTALLDVAAGNANNASMRVRGVSSDPTTLNDGDIWHVLTGGWKYYNGSATRTLSTLEGNQTFLGTNAFTSAININGSSTGSIAIQTQAAAGTYNFNLPTTPGSSGQILASGGGGSNPHTYISAGVARVSPIDSLPGAANGAQILGRNLLLQTATNSQNGLLSSTDHTAYNNVVTATSGTDVVAQTAATQIGTATLSADGTYRVGGYVNITAIATDVLKMQLGWTDVGGTSRTQDFYPQGAASQLLSTTGYIGFPTMDIRAKAGTSIVINYIIATGGGTINYDAGATFTKLR